MSRRTIRSFLSVTLAIASSAHAQTCPTCVPLTDLGSGLYLGQHEGGLYPGGVNEPTGAHAAALAGASSRVVPRLRDGTPSRRGLIGVLSIGMSNTNQEFSVFERDIDLDDSREARALFVNGAVGGQSAEIVANPDAPYWTTVAERIDRAGLSPEQVQVVYLKQAMGSLPTTAFPAHAELLRDTLGAIVRDLKSRYPNLEVCYIASRSYGGYSTSPFRWEPLSYETGFAAKWLIEAQIAGDPSLNSDPDAGPVVAPTLAWGAYLWANGTTPRSDGLFYARDDYQADGVHPTERGERKIADLMLAFFADRTTDRAWLANDGAARLIARDTIADASVSAGAPMTNFGALPALQAVAPADIALVRFPPANLAPGEAATHVKMSVRALSNLSGLQVFHAPGAWSETTVTYDNAPTPVGSPIGSFAPTNNGAAGATLHAPVRAGGPVSLALVSSAPAGSVKRLASRESGSPARLVVTALRCAADADDDGVVGFADLNEVLSAFGQSGDPGAIAGDINADGTVNFADLNAVLAAFGTLCE